VKDIERVSDYNRSEEAEGGNNQKRKSMMRETNPSSPLKSLSNKVKGGGRYWG